MKKLLLLLITILFSVSITQAQQAQIVVVDENGNDVGAFTTLNQALNAAPNNATYYIPGGIFNITDTINKKVHFIGAGSRYDSTIITSKTFINSDIYLRLPSNGSIFEGIYTNNFFILDSVLNLLFNRSHINTIGTTIGYSYGDAIGSHSITNSQIINCYIGGINVKYYNSSISNSIIGSTSYARNSIIRNCFSFGGGANNKNLIVKNCYTSSYYFVGGANWTNYFNENISLINNLLIDTGIYTSVSINNISYQNLSTTFINVPNSNYNESYNYQLKSTSPGKNAGDDGTDIGIYGGAYPWKEGAVPSNPHISKKVVGGQTDNNGNLNINVTVRGQNN